MNTYRKYLPSRPLVAFVLVPALTIFVLWNIGYVRDYQAQKGLAQEENFTNTLSSARAEYNKRDTDGDLLQDWEEFLYETDIEKKDTDGDGLDDYQEVLDPIRDPLVADAELGRTQATTTAADGVIGDDPYYAYDDSLNTTEKISRDIFNTFSQIQQSDNQEQVKRVLLEKVPEVIAEREGEEGQYTIENLSVVASIGRSQDKKRYLDQYKKAVAPLQAATTEKTEIALIEEYGKTKDPALLEILEERSRLYNTFATELLEVQVTEDIAPVHLELVNNYDTLSRYTLKISRAETDPIGAIAGASGFIDNMVLIEANIRALSVYLYGT